MRSRLQLFRKIYDDGRSRVLVIAYDEIDAKLLWGKPDFWGTPSVDLCKNLQVVDASEVVLISPSWNLPSFNEIKAEDAWSKTAAEWIAEKGRGMLDWDEFEIDP